MSENSKKEEKQNKKEVNKLALLSYFWILCIVPLLSKEKDDFVKFHSKQGLVLLICEIATWAVFGFVPFLWFMVNILWVVWLIFSIIGIVNVLNGKKKELPFIGKYAEKANL